MPDPFHARARRASPMPRHESDRLLEPRWRVPALVVLQLAALALLATWLWPPLRATWDRLDAATFALVMLAVLIRGGLVFAAGRMREAFYAFAAILVLLLAIRTAVFSPLVAHFHWQRASPSLTVKGAVLISELFPGWQGLLHVKDSSGRAFPGDHASVLMLWALFVSAFAGGWRRWLVWSLAALFMLPRVVAGAHWLSDVLVGGTFLALTTIAWGLCTPYAARAAALMDRLATPLALRLGRLPGLRRLAFFSAR